MRIDEFYNDYTTKVQKALEDVDKVIESLDKERFNFNLNIIKDTINEINKNEIVITRAIFTDEQFDHIYDYSFQLEVLAPNLTPKECEELASKINNKVANRLVVNFKCDELFFVNVVSEDRDLCYEDYSKIINFN